LVEERAVLLRARHSGPFLAVLAVLAVLALGGVTACRDCGDTPKGRDAAPVDATSSPAAPSSSESAVDAARPAMDAATTSAFDAAAFDAGPSSCRLVYGPAEQPFRGPAAMLVTPTELRLVANDGGKPRIYLVPVTPPPPASAPSVAAPAPSSFLGMRWPPCEIAGKFVYCQAAGGIVYRTTLGTTDTKQIAKSRASTRIAAAPLGADHSVLATLDVRHTTEGDRLQAFITLDDGETTRLSEEGAGATVVRLVPRGDRAVALYLDARTSMLPVHARPLGLRGKDLALDDDAVVYVGSPPERGIEITPAITDKSLFALIATGRDTLEFGMAAIPIAEKPKDDVKPIWSFYPNGIDPAPIAATTNATGDAWVARLRPSEQMPGAPRIIELGRVDSSGAFRSLGALVTGKHITDVAIASDAHGAVWVLYGDANATWLERRLCP